MKFSCALELETIGGTGTTFLDLCLSQVSTVVTKFHSKGELPTGEMQLDLQLVDEMPSTLQDVEVGRDGDLDSPLTLELWKLSSQEVP